MSKFYEFDIDDVIIETEHSRNDVDEICDSVVLIIGSKKYGEIELEFNLKQVSTIRELLDHYLTTHCSFRKLKETKVHFPKPLSNSKSLNVDPI